MKIVWGVFDLNGPGTNIPRLFETNQKARDFARKLAKDAGLTEAIFYDDGSGAFFPKHDVAIPLGYERTISVNQITLDDSK